MLIRSALLILMVLCAAMLSRPLSASGADGKRPPRAPDATAWELTVKQEGVDDHFLEFPGSKVSSVHKFAVYHQAIDFNKPAGQESHYKTFYANRDKILGSKQFGSLNLPSDTLGLIRVINASESTDAAAAAAIVVRLFLEISPNKNFPTSIIVDGNVYSDFLKGMYNAGFSPYPKGVSPRDIHPQAKAILQVISDPRGKDEFVMYR